MIDLELVLLAMRTRALSVTIATTGAVSQTATLTGYHRAAGSYLDDGFRPGHEITSVTGFLTSGNNQSTSVAGRVITAVTASDITCPGTTAETPPVSATITVGLPFCQAWEDIDTQPVANRPYVEESYVPATAELIAGPAVGGLLEETGLYILKFYAPPNLGGYALRKTANAVRALFTPGTAFTITGGRVHVSEKTAPWVGQVLRTDDGWSVVVLTIPWYSETTNAVAA